MSTSNSIYAVALKQKIINTCNNSDETLFEEFDELSFVLEIRENTLRLLCKMPFFSFFLN